MRRYVLPEELGRQERDVTHGHYQRQADIWVNTTEPDAMGYHTHYAVDGGKARIILTALVTPSEVMDNQPMQALPRKQTGGVRTKCPRCWRRRRMSSSVCKRLSLLG